MLCKEQQDHVGKDVANAGELKKRAENASRLQTRPTSAMESRRCMSCNVNTKAIIGLVSDDGVRMKANGMVC